MEWNLLCCYWNILKKRMLTLLMKRTLVMWFLCLLTPRSLADHRFSHSENKRPDNQIFCHHKHKVCVLLFGLILHSWSSRPSNNNQGNETLHNSFAQFYWKLHDFEQAQKHFLRGNTPKEYTHHFGCLTYLGTARCLSNGLRRHCTLMRD